MLVPLLLAGAVVGIAVAVAGRYLVFPPPDTSGQAVVSDGTSRAGGTTNDMPRVPPTTAASGKTPKSTGMSTPPVRPPVTKPDRPQPEFVDFAVTTAPPGAKVRIDGKDVGKANGAPLPVQTGSHTITLTLKGFRPYKRTVEFQSSPNPRPLDVTLQPMTYSVTITTDPPGAPVSVNGGKPLKGAGARLDLPAGTYTLTATLGRYKNLEQRFLVSEDRSTWEVAARLVADPMQARRFALLVGVHAPGGGLPDFVHAEPDAAELGRVLLAAGYKRNDVVVLTQSAGKRDAHREPSLAAIRARLRELADPDPARGCTPADTVIVALVGRQVRAAGGPCFCPAGADPARPATLLPLAEVYQQLGRECRAGTRLLLLDGWRSDEPAAKAGAKGVPVCRTRDDGPAPPEGLAVFYACSAGESGYEHPEERHGLFFNALLEGLQGAAADEGQDDVTLAGLGRRVTEQVRARASKVYGESQRPELVAAQPLATRPLLTLTPVLRAYRRACGHLDRARPLAENNPEKKKEAENAVKALDDAAEADPGYVEIYTRRAEARYYLGENDRAVADCDLALEPNRDPDNATAYSHKGDAQLDLEQLDAAVASYTRAVELDPGYAAAYCDLGNALRARADQRAKNHKDLPALKDYRKASENYARAMRLQPHWARPHTELGRLHERQHNREAAIHEYQEAVKLDLKAAEPHYYLGDLYADGKTKDLGKAIKHFGEAIKRSKAAGDDDTLGSALRRRGDMFRARGGPGDLDRAIEDYLKAKEKRLADKRVWFGLGAAYNARGDYPDAVNALTEALRLARGNYPAADEVLKRARQGLKKTQGGG
jgi:tetratricopeptide (TPR) repeat protein